MQNFHLDHDVLEQQEFSNYIDYNQVTLKKLQSDLNINVTDSEKGRAVCKAMISIDSMNITGVCNHEGQVCINSVPFGTYLLDIISAGFIAQRIVVNIHNFEVHKVHVKMISNI